MRLRTLSFILLTTIALIPSLIVSLVIYQKTYQLVEMGVEEKLDRVAQQISSDILHQVELLTTSLNLLSEQKTMRLGVDNLLYSEQVWSALNNFGKNNPLIESLYLISKDGFVVESYAGNISALEESHILKLESASNSLHYVSKSAADNLMIRSWFLHFENPDLLAQENEKHGIAFIVPIYSVVQLDSVQLYGYLLAVVPVSRLTALANKVKTAQEKINFSLQEKVIAGDLINMDVDSVTKSSRIAFSSPNYKNILWLNLNVAQSTEAITASIFQVLSPVLNTAGIILLVLLLIAIILAHLFSRTFHQLSKLIYRFEQGSTVSSSPFFILEFKDVNNLLQRLQKTISQQMRTLKDKNSELIKVNQLREKYLTEVSKLNAGLELQVVSRTSALKDTLSKVEHSHFIFEQLILFRRRLELCRGNRSVAKTILTSIDTCLPEVAIALFLPEQYKHQRIFRSNNMMAFDFSAINENFICVNNQPAVDKIIILDGTPLHLLSFNVGNDLCGWLIINQGDESKKNSWLTLFITEISSYLMMRALNENLDMLASTDSLTGLKNRKAFDQLLDKLEGQANSDVGLFVIDVNGLKEINDLQGHEQGDALIINAATVLNRCSENISNQVFRIGGDEFAIVVSADELKFVNKLTVNLVQQQLLARKKESNVSFAFGYTSTSECAFSMLYKVADGNMYRDKENYYSRRKGDK